MTKALAVVRTLVFIFLAGYAVRVLPWGWSRTFDEEFARCTETRALAIRAAWLAIGWIALEVALGWWMATRGPKIHRDLPKAGEPPFAPPPRG
jgi:heme A synthase